MDSNSWKSESVTIVGSSCRLPGSATSPSKLWDLPKNPTDVSSQISSTEGFSTTDLYHKDEDYHGVSYKKRLLYLGVFVICE
ncbi:hypothetical protein ANO14919_075390 [Xylariales sp. No.14919]|nr:hypothetical protein ANO14919_075390 [Xylariales sp. No.14919]